MLKYLSILFFLSLFSKVSAHQYFFAFAEVEYSEFQERFEGTLIFSSHDLEDVLKKNGVFSIGFDKLKHNAETNLKLGKEIFKTFKIKSDEHFLNLDVIEFSLLKNGQIEIYFNSQKAKLTKNVYFEFYTLMEVFPQQQNKLTFIKNNFKQTIDFLSNKKGKSILIKP